MADKDQKSAEFYLGPGVTVIDKAEDEDEWEGAMLDTELLEALEGLADLFWVPVWVEVKKHAQELKFQPSTYDENRLMANLFTGNDPGLLNVPCYRDLDQAHAFWNYDIGVANRLGWDWSGDTQVLVYKVAATNIAEVCVACLLKYGRYGADISVDQCRRTDVGQPWPEFWYQAVRGENNLPRLSGVTGEVAIPIATGNERISIARVGNSNLFYVVEFMTS